MCVQIDEAWCDDQASCIEDMGVFRRELGAVEQTDDTAFIDQDVASGVYLLCRIDHVAIRNQQFHCWGALRSRFCFLTGGVSSSFSKLPPASRYNTAMRTATPFVT